MNKFIEVLTQFIPAFTIIQLTEKGYRKKALKKLGGNPLWKILQNYFFTHPLPDRQSQY